MSPLKKKFVFYCQHIGTGVLLATAFVHLLPTAFTSLTNPCLPDVFSKRYTPMAGLVAMVSALVVVGVESYLSAAGAGHSHTHATFWDDDESVAAVPVAGPSPSPDHDEHGGLAARRHRRPTDIRFLHDMEATESEGLVAGVSPRPGETPLPSGNVTPLPRKESQEVDDADSDIELDLNELDPAPVDEAHRPLNAPGAAFKFEPTLPDSHVSVTPEEQSRLFLQCLLLEAGILFHSLFIGMALSVATGPTFYVFLFAISFHTSFEGLALGTRIAAIQLSRKSIRPWLMVLAFGMTTPVGQAIGLVIHNMYDPHSQTGLLLVGFMNAISSGLLLFAGLVQLLAEDFLTEKSYQTLRGRRRVQAFVSVVGGALLMAAVRALASH
jgi:solute carrier family 39 (zinc transporter), member 1/2/3